MTDQTRQHARHGELSEGDRVELHPATDRWMAGDRYATVLAVKPYPQQPYAIEVLCERSGDVIEVRPDDLKLVRRHDEISAPVQDHRPQSSEILTVIADPGGNGLYGSPETWIDAHYAFCNRYADGTAGRWFYVEDRSDELKAIFGSLPEYPGEYVERDPAQTVEDHLEVQTLEREEREQREDAPSTPSIGEPPFRFGDRVKHTSESLGEGTITELVDAQGRPFFVEWDDHDGHAYSAEDLLGVDDDDPRDDPDMLERHKAVRKYIDAIRNYDKRAYAERYYHDVVRNGLPEPERPDGLGPMAAQAVRMNIDVIMRGEAI